MKTVKPAALPKAGDRLRDKLNGGSRLFRVAEVFPAGAHPGMILDWQEDDRTRGQTFTTRDWADRWEVVR